MDSDNESEAIPETPEVRDENTFKILIASDIHLGYNGDNPAREEDGFITFEEILQIGRDENVDFVLLGGDLFHENKPQPECLRKTMEIMRTYCLGSKPVEFEYLGDPAVDFPNQDHPEVNYQNPDINIAMPVFTIHGNHDDPIGARKTSAVDHLVAAKLLNHFGQWDDLDKITIKPVPLIKGETKLALFGLGNLKDQRLFRLMRDQKVQYVRPKESQNDWFNLFVLHQNRAKHGVKNYIPENFLPGFLDLAVWGHEHECRIDPEPSEADVKTYIIQPGSSVATSLCAGEAKEKFVGVLHINRRKFRMEKKKLRTVRPFIFQDIQVKNVLAGASEGSVPSQTVETYVEARVKQLINDALDLLTGHEKQPVQPLIRVRVFHEGSDDAFNPVRFAQKFAGKIANEDIVMFKRTSGKRTANDEMDVEDMDDLIDQHTDGDLDSHVEKIVELFFTNARQNEDHENLLEVLSERGLSEAVKSSVEKNDKEALSVIIEAQMEKVIEHLIHRKVTEDNINETLDEFRTKRFAQADKECDEVFEILKNRPVGKFRVSANASGSDEELPNGSGDEENDEVSVIGDDDDDEPAVPKRGAAKGRGRGQARGAARGRGRGRGKANTSDSSVSPSKPRGRGRGRVSAAASSSRGRARNVSPLPDSKAKKNLVQTTLPVRRSPRKGGAMVFDVSDDSD